MRARWRTSPRSSTPSGGSRTQLSRSWTSNTPRNSRSASQISKRNAKYADYNNAVDEAEREYALRREDDIADFLAEREKERLEREEQQRREEAEFGYRGAKQENYAERYNIALDFYTSLSPDIAADALAASPSMKYYLGNYYDKLMGVLRGDSSAASIYF